ncbi:hypothetical protein M8J77_014497 [Diaphorina citri]|nr:hypothetical protein M8J77_014497 [Diaphorina citri]
MRSKSKGNKKTQHIDNAQIEICNALNWIVWKMGEKQHLKRNLIFKFRSNGSEERDEEERAGGGGGGGGGEEEEEGGEEEVKRRKEDNLVF